MTTAEISTVETPSEVEVKRGLESTTEAFCSELRSEIKPDGAIPEIAQCNLDSDSETGDFAIVVAFKDPVTQMMNNNIEISFESAFAPLTALAGAFSRLSGDLDDIKLVLVFFKDECGNVWEVKPETLKTFGSGGIDLEGAMSEVEIFGTPNCP